MALVIFNSRISKHCVSIIFLTKSSFQNGKSCASRAVGMKAIWKRNELFDQEVEVEADACIDDLSEILRWLLPSSRQA
ncbi:hypothetical protein P9761_00580 [Brevibacillus centrosporus]|nr:hypothetical protein [Brevibacillus centrosporus]MEC2130122.1 hypothetical protein [Brevibacillus centrosporus]MED4906763.1 hypothetical protein [Brevibacillus centrosporus]